MPLTLVLLPAGLQIGANISSEPFSPLTDSYFGTWHQSLDLEVGFHLFSSHLLTYPGEKEGGEDEDEDDEDDGEDDAGDDADPLFQHPAALRVDHQLGDLQLERDGGGVEHGAHVVQLHHRARQVGQVVTEATGVPEP